MNAGIFSGLELFGAVLAFLLTIAVLSYVLGDNPVYRFAVYLLAGVGIGYAVVMVVDAVVLPWLLDVAAALTPGAAVDWLALVPPIVLGALLALKLSPGAASYGNIAMGFLVGVGAALVVAGAVAGTLIPQTVATVVPPSEPDILFTLVNGSVVVIGTAFSLMYFFYGPTPIYFMQPQADTLAKRSPLIQVPMLIGQFFVLTTLATLYVGALNTAWLLLAERMAYLTDTVFTLLGS